MNRSILLIILLFVVLHISACTEQNEELEKIEVPIWDKTDIEIEKLQGVTISVYDHEINGNKPKFYDGGMPLQYKTGYPPWGLPGYTYGMEKPLFYDFADFTTFFVYNGPIAVGAQTYDKEGNLVAEVGNIEFYITEEKEQGITIEEFHYDHDGNIIFTCKSQIDPYSGDKMREKERIGRKIRDYYFIWPV